MSTNLTAFHRYVLQNDMAIVYRNFKSTFVTLSSTMITSNYAAESTRMNQTVWPQCYQRRLWNAPSIGYCTNRTKPSPSVILRDLSEQRIAAPLKNGQKLIINKFNSLYKSYEDMSHTSEIREAHLHVEKLQEELKLAQERRRDISRELSDIRYELQLVYADLANCKKGEPRYLELIRKEYEIHHQEKQKNEEFDLLDKTERDLFIHLQAAVKTSHEKEKVHTNSAKYWSIVGSLLGALLGICGTAFSFYNRSNTVTQMLTEVKSEFILLREDTTKMALEMKKLTELNSKMLAMQTFKVNNVVVSKEKPTNPSWTSWSLSWTYWIGSKTGLVATYKYLFNNQNK